MSDLRLYIVFRADLPEMTRAKGEVQAAHAVASLLYKELWLTNPVKGEVADRWEKYMGDFDALVTEGQIKIAMEVDDQAALTRVYERALLRDVPVVCIQDAGRTVFKEPTVTCLAFGPCTKTDGNAIARGARMRK